MYRITEQEGKGDRILQILTKIEETTKNSGATKVRNGIKIEHKIRKRSSNMTKDSFFGSHSVKVSCF